MAVQLFIFGNTRMAGCSTYFPPLQHYQVMFNVVISRSLEITTANFTLIMGTLKYQLVHTLEDAYVPSY